MRSKTTGSSKWSDILAYLFLTYLFISLIFIFFPKAPILGRVSGLYKRYVTPGPFFSENRITDTYLLYVARKSNGEWSPLTNPALENHISFFEYWNPSFMYRGRLERSIYENAINDLPALNELQSTKAMESLKSYVHAHNDLMKSDSIKMIFVKAVVIKRKMQCDTLRILIF